MHVLVCLGADVLPELLGQEVKEQADGRACVHERARRRTGIVSVFVVGHDSILPSVG